MYNSKVIYTNARIIEDTNYPGVSIDEVIEILGCATSTTFIIALDNTLDGL